VEHEHHHHPLGAGLCVPAGQTRSLINLSSKTM
jgi:hypothetical protein